MNATPVTPRQKAAALFRLLDPDAASAVAARLRPELQAELNRLVAESANKQLSATTLDLLNEFEQFFQYAQRCRPAQPESVMKGGGSALPSAKAATLGDEFVVSDEPLKDLARLPVVQLAQTLQEEQPRTVAMLASQLPPDRVAELLAQMNEARRGQVVAELMRDRRPAAALLERLASAVLQHALTLPSEAVEPPDRVKRLVQVLRSVEKSQRTAMIAGIEAEDPQTAAQILEQLCEFEDLLEAEDRLVQAVLGQVEMATLAVALAGAEEALKEKVSKNLSSRAKQALSEELEFQKKVSPKKVEQARTAIAQVLAKLDREQDQD